ncbi:MAG: FAD-binding protein [Gammaproteobacteria bacterium]|nr:FAD-binding protein [Gammaproteobacteria bacterium]
MSVFSRFIDSLPKLGQFTAIPAGIIDRAYLEEPKGFFANAWAFFKVRAVFAFLFIPLAVVDLVSSAVLGLSYALRTFLTSDAKQAKRLEQQQKYATLFSKNLFGILGSIFGLFNPKLVAFYFTPEKSNLSGVLAGGSYYHAADVERVQPDSIEALQQLVKLASDNGDKIIPVGAGFSQGKQFLPDNLTNDKKTFVVDLIHLNHVEIHVSEKRAIVGAGARWADIQFLADKSKLALKVMQASNVFSVGGSIGTNIHGWDHQNGVLSNTIASIDIINAQGELQTLTPEDDLFHKVMGGFGLCGIVIRATIQLTDNEKLQEIGTEVSTKDYAEYFYNKVLNDERAKMHLYRLSLDPNDLLGSGVAVSYMKQDMAPVVTKHLSMESAQGTRFERVMLNIARRFDWVRRFYWQGERDRLLDNDSHPLMTTNEIMQPPINAMFNPAVSEAEWLQEYYLPQDNLAEFLERLGQLLMANKVRLLNASVRFVKQHQGPLSYCDQDDRFAVVLCFNQSLQASHVVQAKKWLRQAQHMTVKLGGAYYLPYQHVSSPEAFNAAYPRAAEFQDAKNKVDPAYVFTSGFHQKYLIAKTPAINHFKAVMDSSNPQMKESFRGFLDNVLQRIDSDAFYTLLEDVITYNDSHEEIYQELCRRLPEVMPSALGGLQRILNSLSSIKNDLGEQARGLLPRQMKEINGLVEIGYPGRFIGKFKAHYRVSGTVAAVYEGPSVTDYIQTGFPRPYNTFVKLDYNEPNLASLDSNSADVITCYVGLHHFPIAPDDKLDTFLKEIRRVLRDGGKFLLVDHDIDSDATLTMAHMAHMIFNAVSGTSVAEEMSEIRNFQPMNYWNERLEKHGLGVMNSSDEHKIRTGDPSRNRMMCFKKAAPAPVIQPIIDAHMRQIDCNLGHSSNISTSPNRFFAPASANTQHPTDTVEAFKYIA